MKTLVLYDSLGGNTEKIARRIYDTVLNSFEDVDFRKVSSDSSPDFLSYDLVFLGSPVIDWLPTKKLMNCVQKKMKEYNAQGLIPPSCPLKPGKFGICFGSYAGPHIGVNEALPMTAWMRSFFEHIGYQVPDVWHIPGCLHRDTELNLRGRLGDILQRPTEQDLLDVENRTRGVLEALAPFRRRAPQAPLLSGK